MEIIKLYTIREIAEVLKVTRATMYNYLYDGMPKFSAKPLRFELDKVLEWIQQRKK